MRGGNVLKAIADFPNSSRICYMQQRKRKLRCVGSVPAFLIYVIHDSSSIVCHTLDIVCVFLFNHTIITDIYYLVSYYYSLAEKR